MLNRIFALIWTGFFLGMGAELSFFVLWVFWHGLHSQVAHRFDPEHLFHKIHDYFSS